MRRYEPAFSAERTPFNPPPPTPGLEEPIFPMPEMDYGLKKGLRTEDEGRGEIWAEYLWDRLKRWRPWRPGQPPVSSTMATNKVACLDAREQAVMDHILAAMNGIQDLGLRCNETELTIHVHGLQSFVIQHMLQRVEPAEWGSWFDDDQLPAQAPPTNPGKPTR